MRPGHEDRIAHLFKRGHSLDLIAELGVMYGWTRIEAKRVLAAKGWALDWTGRLQPHLMREAMPAGVPLVDADPERLLNAGVDHESPEVRKAAASAERALERLRNALVVQEARDAVTAAAAQRAQDVVLEALNVVLGVTAPDGSVRPN